MEASPPRVNIEGDEAKARRNYVLLHGSYLVVLSVRAVRRFAALI